MRMNLVLVIAVGGLLVAACGADVTPTSTPSPTPGSTKTTEATQAGISSEPITFTSEIRDKTHRDLTIEVGTTVAWLQQDKVPHTATSGRPDDPNTGELWDSPVLSKGESFSYTLFERCYVE